MQALVYTKTRKISFQDLDETIVDEPGFVQVDLHASGICGSDMHAYYGHDERRVPPLILGHEASGVARNGIFAGQRVVLNPLMTCGHCPYCQTSREHLCAKRELVGMRIHGTHAESVSILEKNLIPIADNLSFSQAALSEPLACAVHAVRLSLERVSLEAEKKRFLIIGGGAIGLLCAKVLLIEKAHNLSIVEINPIRHKMLRDSLPGVQILNTAANTTADVVIDAAGSSNTRAIASQIITPGGVIVHVGLQDNKDGLDCRKITLQEVSFVGCYCYTQVDFKKAVTLLEEKKVVGDGWTENRPLCEGAQAFADLADGKAAAKVILNMPAS